MRMKMKRVLLSSALWLPITFLAFLGLGIFMIILSIEVSPNALPDAFGLILGIVCLFVALDTLADFTLVIIKKVYERGLS